MKTYLLFFIFLCGIWSPCLAQLTIEECQRRAQTNYPLIKQYALIEKTKEYNLKNVARGYLPQLAFSAEE